MSSTVLQRFPKSHTALPEPYRAIYDDHYRRNRDGIGLASSLSRKMESWMHRKVARDALPGARTLEIGAGNLNHLQYEPHSRVYDVVENLDHLIENSPQRSLVRNAFGTIHEISSESYDRIISIAAFEHFCNLPEVVAHCGPLLAPDGQLRVAIPSEGTLLWTLGWKLTTGLDFRLRHGLDYGVLMRYEHVNTASEVSEILHYYFKDVRREVYGVSPALSLYQFFECRQFATG